MNSFNYFGNSNESQYTTLYPFLLGDVFDNIAVSFHNALEMTHAVDVIVAANTSFLIFRYDLENLKVFPSGGTLENVFNACSDNTSNGLFSFCNDTDWTSGTSEKGNGPMKQDYSVSELNRCSCEILQDFVKDRASAVYVSPSGPAQAKVRLIDAGEGEFIWEEDEENSDRPLIAVVVSLCVSVMAVIALILGYMLVEMSTRRKHVRNTKIRPFLS